MTNDERERVLNDIRAAGEKLKSTVDVRLIPESGLELGYALKGARDPNAVAGLNLLKNPVDAVSLSCDFGLVPDISRSILTVMRFDPKIRSSATIRCTKPVYTKAMDLFFDVPFFESAKEPRGISTQDWGVASCSSPGSVPQVIANIPTPQKPALLRFFGETPHDVATNIIMLSNRVINIEIQDRSEWE